MTLDQFLLRLAKTPRTWHLTDSGAIRKGVQCPIDAVAHPVDKRLIDPFGKKPDYLYRMSSPMAGAMKLGLGVLEARQIMLAADNANESEPLRSKLLRACGLKNRRIE